MHLKKIVRKSDKIYITLLNIPVAKVEFDDARKIKFLYGILYIKNNPISLEKSIRIFGFLVYRKRNTDLLKYKALYKKLAKNKKLHKYVYIFNGAPSRELYIVLNLMNSIIRNIDINDILFIVDKEFKKNLCNLYFPNINCIVEKKINLYVYKQNRFIYKKVIFTSIFDTKHYIEQDKKINSENVHYYDYILKDLNLENNINFKLPDISGNICKKIKNYVDINELKILIIISPEANTSQALCKNFWIRLCQELKQRNYNIFLNIMKMENYIDGCFVNYFTYEELIELNKYSKAIIGLRSGLIEILSTIGTPIHCLYTPFPRRGCLRAMSSQKALIGFTLTKLPNINKDNIYEYDATKFSEDNLLNTVLTEFEDAVKR